MSRFFKSKKKEKVEDEPQEEVKDESGKEEEVKVLSPILKYLFIGLICFIVILVVSSDSINYGVDTTFELIGGAIAVVFLVLAVAQKFQDKMKFAKGVLLFIGICLFANISYLGILWAGEEVYSDNTLWSPIIFAIIVIGAVAWFTHWFGSPHKKPITTLSIFIGLMAYILIAIGLGGDEGSRFAFIFTIAFEVVVIRLAIPSFLRVRGFKGTIQTRFDRYLVTGLHAVIFFGFLVEAITLPVKMVAIWPLTNWQIVVTCLSCTVAWYLVYAVIGKD